MTMAPAMYPAMALPVAMCWRKERGAVEVLLQWQQGGRAGRGRGYE